MEKFKSEHAEGESLQKHSSETERPWPLINFEESRFIEDTGGEYQGFVENENGKRDFGEVWVNKCAYYDDLERAVVETFVSTEGVNDEGGNELQGPSEVEGFMLMIVRKSRSGHELGKADIISLQPGDFPGKQMSVEGLRRVAHDAHNFVVEQAPHLKSSELRTRLETRLHREGWRGDR
jgi:hypothetical protein